MDPAHEEDVPRGIEPDPFGDLVRSLVGRFLRMSEDEDPTMPPNRTRVVAMLDALAAEFGSCARDLDRSGDESIDVTRRNLERAIADRGLARQLAQTQVELPPSTRSGSAFRMIEVPESCPKCGGEMSRKKGRYGVFMGCARYPECDGKQRASLGVACPEPDCTGHLVEKSKDDVVPGNAAQSFVGCSAYKSKGQGCSYVVWTAPERIPCHRCGIPFVLDAHGVRSCIDPECIAEHDMEPLRESEKVGRLLKYALRLCPTALEGAATVAVAAGLICGMSNAAHDSASGVFDEAFKRGHAWYERAQESSPGAAARARARQTKF